MYSCNSGDRSSSAGRVPRLFQMTTVGSGKRFLASRRSTRPISSSVAPVADKQPERIVVILSELQSTADRAGSWSGIRPASRRGRPRHLVHCASGQHIAAQRVSRGLRGLFAVPQIAGQQSDFFRGFLSWVSPSCVPRSSVRFQSRSRKYTRSLPEVRADRCRGARGPGSSHLP